MTPRCRFAAFVAVSSWALAACNSSPPPTPGATAASPLASVASVASVASEPGRLPACKLSVPLKSDDPCSTDADCGVSQPCHATACVARARSHPATAEIMCTQSFECHSADANRCGCFEGRCALIPPS